MPTSFLRTPEAYLEGLRDGREVYFRGQRVEDVTSHPELSVGARHCATDYALATTPEHRELSVVENGGVESNRFYHTPADASDLLGRRELIAASTYAGHGIVTLIREIGSDFLFAHSLVAQELNQSNGLPYAERLRAFHDHVRENDLAMAVAQTDAKGDRSRGPSDQEHPDYYLRVVERREDGVVVRGAKAHTTNAIYSDEIIAVPTRAMSPGDEDYAVCVAVPANTPGLKFIVSPMSGGGASQFHYPVSSEHRMMDTLTVFDDVFVPWDRVLLCGETTAAGALANGFVEFHRFTAISYKLPLIDLMIGSAILLAESNGVERASHVREKLAELITYRETLRSLTVAAAYEFEIKGEGVAVPNTTVTNIAKAYFASNYHTMVQKVQDIAGGLVVTGPSEEDLENPETGDYIEKYLGGRVGTGTRNRLRLFNLVRDVLASDLGGYHEVLAIHAEGSLEAQKITILRNFDPASVRAFAAECAHLLPEP